MKVMFLDESGDHSLSFIDPQYPVFVLGGVIMDKDYAEGPLVDSLTRFKSELFDNPDIILHTSDISRNRNGFEPLKEPSFRRLFYERLNDLMATLPYSVIACAVKKTEHLARYELAALDPYLLSLGILVERFCFEIGNVNDGGAIVAESRNSVLDSSLVAGWRNLQQNGTYYLEAETIDNRISELELRNKSENIAGLQLADLVVSPIGRHVIGKSDKLDWEIVRQKFRRSYAGRIDGYGLIVLPKDAGPAPATQ